MTKLVKLKCLLFRSCNKARSCTVDGDNVQLKKMLSESWICPTLTVHRNVLHALQS